MGNGDVGPDREALDTLRALGYVDAAQRAGEDDPQATAVRSYQTSRRLAVNGELDAATVATLDANYCSVPPRGKPGSDPAKIAPPWVLPSDGSSLSLSFQFGEGFPAGAEAAVRSAMQTWEGALYVKFVPYARNGRPAPQVLFEWVVVADLRLDGAMAAYVTPPPPYRPLPAGRGLQANQSVQVRFNGRGWNDAAGTLGGLDLQSVALHELGHVLGLHHSGSPGAVMSPVLYPGERRRDLQVADLVPAARRYKPQELVKEIFQQSAFQQSADVSDVFADSDEFTGKLQAGDVLLFEGLDPFAALLQWIDGTPFNHAAIFLGHREELPKELQALVPDDIDIVTIHAGLSRALTLDRPDPGAKNSTIRFVELMDVLDPLDIGMQGENRTAMIIRPAEKVNLAALYAKVGQLRQVPTDFDYGNLAELSEAWIGRAYARLPRFGPEMPPLLDGMLPLLQQRAANAQAVAGNRANASTTCARLVYDLLEAAGATPVIDADRDLATATNLPLELRATRMFITPGDLLTSPSLNHEALLVLQS
jgi:hypothetical protein